VKTIHRLIPRGIYCLFTLLQTMLPQTQDLVPHITLIELVRIHLFLSPVDIQLTCLFSTFQLIDWFEHEWFFSFKPLYYLLFFALQFLIILLTTFSNFLNSKLILVFIYEKTAKLKMVNIMTNENIHESTNANYVGCFLNCVIFYIVNVFDLFQIIFTEF